MLVQCLIKAGVPFHKVDISTSSSLSQLISFILENEIAHLKDEIGGQHVSIIFDGTTHVCEALVVLLRFLDTTLTIQQRVCRLMLRSVKEHDW